jgi:hypothetical protein
VKGWRSRSRAVGVPPAGRISGSASPESTFSRISRDSAAVWGTLASDSARAPVRRTSSYSFANEKSWTLAIRSEITSA